jgi:hypothetical protein
MMLLDVRFLLNLRITFPLIHFWFLNLSRGLILVRTHPPLLDQDQDRARLSK